MKLLTKQGIIKSQTECAPNNGYFLIPLYDKVIVTTILFVLLLLGCRGISEFECHVGLADYALLARGS